mgnify:CR=1 FL=1
MDIKPLNIKPLSEYRHGELALVILKGLAVGGLFIAVLALPGLAQVLVLFKPKNSRERFRVKRTIHSLERQGLLRVNSKNGVLSLTNRGKKEVDKNKIYNLCVKPQKVWDGMFRVIIFDIPNTKKSVRNAVNFHLKRMGFIPIQKSTFIIPFECKSELDLLGKYLNIRNHLKYLLVKKIDGEQEIKKVFGLL